MDVKEIYTKVFQLNGIDDNNLYSELTGDQISTVQLVEPSLGVSPLIIPEWKSPDKNNHIDKLAYRIPVVAIDDYVINQVDLTAFKLDYSSFIPTVMVEFVDTTNAMLSTNVIKDGSIIKVYVGGNGDELYYKPIRQDFIITNVKKTDGGNQTYGEYFKYKINGKLNVPYGYRKEAWCAGNSTAMQELFNLSIYTGLGFATNFTKEFSSSMTWINSECETYFDFIEEVASHACYSPNTFFTTFIDQYNVLNFMECHSLLSHGGKKTDVPAVIYNSVPADSYPDSTDNKTPNDQLNIYRGDDLNNNQQKLSYYYLSNNDFFYGWTNYIEEYTEINNGHSSISDGYRMHVIYSDSNVEDWGFTECEFIIPPIDNLKRNGVTQNIESLPIEVGQESYIPLNLMQMTKTEYQEGNNISVDDMTKVESYVSFGEVDTTNMFKQYYFAEAQNKYQMRCLKKCGLKVILQNYNPAITKFSRIWVDIYDKNLISTNAITPSENESETSGIFYEYKSAKNKGILKFSDEGVIDIIEDEKRKNKNWPRGEYNRSLSGWYVITELEIYYDSEDRNLKMKLTLNRIEYQPCFKSEYDVAQKAVEKYKNDNKIENLIIQKDDFSYS